ncbi:MAG: hypothetical protein D6778_00565, partial [Nitrospirae bacterium]
MDRLSKGVIIPVSVLLVVGLLSTTGATSSFRKRLHQVNKENLQYATDEDIKAELVFGRSLAARILGRYPLLKDKKLTRYINLVGKSIARYAARPEIEFHFGVLDTPAVNALSTPGGYVFVTRGALEIMDDEAELAGVLAHEIAHIRERHIVKEINLQAPETSPVSGLATLLGGTTGTAEAVFSTLVDKAYEILFERGYKRQDELSADRIATELIYFAGYDPTGLLRFLKKVPADKENFKNFQGTHPGIKERIKSIDKFLISNHITNP